MTNILNKIFVDQNGYPRWKDSGKLVHRTMAAIKVGGRIFRGMIVHHIDGNKMNFRKSNLWILSRSAHASLHARQRKHAAMLMKSKTLSPHFFVSSVLLVVLGFVLKMVTGKKDESS